MRAMRVQTEALALPPDTAACVGAFDGMHIGHQALLDRARALCPTVALVTFEPHPAHVLAPGRAPRLLQSPTQREWTCGRLGVDVLVPLRFDREVAALEPDAFMDRYLLDGLRPRAVVIGEDFRFGAGARGGLDDLRRHLGPAGITVEAIAKVLADDGVPVSSTAIREALDRGDVSLAGALLGRFHAVLGRVVRGERRGRKLGFPTANVSAPDAFMPATGVYATALCVWDERSELHGEVLPAVANLGRNPTFTGGGDAPVILEVHALDVDLGDALYDARVEVSFVERLRDERTFPGPDALVEQIHADVAAARPPLSAEILALVHRPTS